MSISNLIAALVKNIGSEEPQYWQSQPVHPALVTSPQCLAVAQRVASQLQSGCATPLFLGQTVQSASGEFIALLLLSQRRVKEEGAIQSASELRPALAQQEKEGRGTGPRAVPVVQI